MTHAQWCYRVQFLWWRFQPAVQTDLMQNMYKRISITWDQEWHRVYCLTVHFGKRRRSCFVTWWSDNRYYFIRRYTFSSSRGWFFADLMVSLTYELSISMKLSEFTVCVWWYRIFMRYWSHFTNRSSIAAQRKWIAWWKMLFFSLGVLFVSQGVRRCSVTLLLHPNCHDFLLESTSS